MGCCASMRFLKLVGFWALLGLAVADDKVVLRVTPISTEEYKAIVGDEVGNPSEGRLIGSILSGLSGLTAGLTMGKYINSLLGTRNARPVGDYPLCTINARPEGRQMDFFSYDNLEEISNLFQSENEKPVINCVLVVDDRYSIPPKNPVTGPAIQPPHPYPGDPQNPQPPWYTQFLGYLQYPYPTATGAPPVPTSAANPIIGPTFQPTPPETAVPPYPYPHLHDPPNTWYSQFPDYIHYPYPPPTTAPLLTTTAEDPLTGPTLQPMPPPTTYPNNTHYTEYPDSPGYPGYPPYPEYSAYPGYPGYLGYPYYPYPPPQYPYQTYSSSNTDDEKEIESSTQNPSPEKPTYPPEVLSNYSLHSPSTNKSNGDISTRRTRPRSRSRPRPRPRPRQRDKTQPRRPFKDITASPLNANFFAGSHDNVDYFEFAQRFNHP